jgi:hypothetical protein
MSIEIVVLTTKWEDEQCTASAKVFFMDDSPDPVRILDITTHSANHNFLFKGAYGPVSQVVRQVEDLTIEKLKSMLDELTEGRQWQWPEAIREPPTR